jgi:hypothetical protein
MWAQATTLYIYLKSLATPKVIARITKGHSLDVVKELG